MSVVRALFKRAMRYVPPDREQKVLKITSIAITVLSIEIRKIARKHLQAATPEQRAEVKRFIERLRVLNAMRRKAQPNAPKLDDRIMDRLGYGFLRINT
jgi:hypothetical protein